MKHIYLGFPVVFFILILCAGTGAASDFCVSSGESLRTGVSDELPPLISIISPENRTYYTNRILLFASANEPVSEWWYTLDDSDILYFEDSSSFTAETYLKLSKKQHRVCVYGRDLAGNLNSTSVNFTIKIMPPPDLTPPTITINSPLNRSYPAGKIALNATANEAISEWWYVLDHTCLEFENVSSLAAEAWFELSEGSYSVSVYGIDLAGNLNSTNVKFRVETPPPLVNFSYNVTTGPEPLAVSFTDLSENSPTSWLWDFGDGNISGARNPVHVYTAAGTYDVSLTASNAGGNASKTCIACIKVTASAGGGEEIPWDDPESEGGVAITGPELQEAIYCWLNNEPAPGTGAEISTEKLEDLISLWLES